MQDVKRSDPIGSSDDTETGDRRLPSVEFKQYGIFSSRFITYYLFFSFIVVKFIIVSSVDRIGQKLASIFVAQYCLL